MEDHIQDPVTVDDDSILNHVKQQLGIGSDDTSFDLDVVIHINSAIFTLTQLGIGPKTGYSIASADDTFSNFLGEMIALKNTVSLYLYLCTKVGFDTTSMTSYVLESFKAKIQELEWRLKISMEEPLLPELIKKGGEIQNDYN